LKILEEKARGAMKKYFVDLVVANELHTRRTKAIIYKHEGFIKCECKENEVFYMKNA